METPKRPTTAQFAALDLVAAGTVRYLYGIGRSHIGARFYEATSQPWPAGKLNQPTFERLHAAGLIRLVPTDNRNVDRIELTTDGEYARSLRHKVFTCVTLVRDPVLRDLFNMPDHDRTVAIYVVAANAREAADAAATYSGTRLAGDFRLARGNTIDAVRSAGVITGPAVYAATRFGYWGTPLVELRPDCDHRVVGHFRDGTGRTAFERTVSPAEIVAIFRATYGRDPSNRGKGGVYGGWKHGPYATPYLAGTDEDQRDGESYGDWYARLSGYERAEAVAYSALRALED